MKFAFVLLCIVAGFLVFLMAEAAPPRLVITKAEWNAGKAQLTIEGKAQTGVDVLLKDAIKGSFLGDATADSKGIWRFKLAGLSESPTRVAAESGNLNSERVVRTKTQRKPQYPYVLRPAPAVM